jgi:hypothetical protein
MADTGLRREAVGLREVLFQSITDRRRVLRSRHRSRPASRSPAAHFRSPSY